MEIKYPNISVKLIGTDGNAYSLLAKIKKALRENKISQEEQTRFLEEAMSGDYDHLLQTCMNWVKVS